MKRLLATLLLLSACAFAQTTCINCQFGQSDGTKAAIGNGANLSTTKPTGDAWAAVGQSTLATGFESAIELPGDITGSGAWAASDSLLTFTPTVDWSVIFPLAIGSISGVYIKPSAVNGADSYGHESFAWYDAGNNTNTFDGVWGGLFTAGSTGGAAGATTTYVRGIETNATTGHRIGGLTPNAMTTTNQSGIVVSGGVESGMTVTTNVGVDVYPFNLVRAGTITNNYGLRISNMGTGANDYAIRTGTGKVLLGDAVTLTPAARASGVASYFTINIPADTAQTAATESIGYQHVTATRTWATTGTVALQRENFFAGPTYASASASQTFTDAFTVYATPPVQGTNAVFTRDHTLGIVDSTSAASSITGGLVVATTLGTAATSVGIGGGNVNAGGIVTGNTLVSGVSTGTAPLTVASTTQVTNLNSSQLVGATWVAPGTIGSTTPSTGAFTSLAAGSAKFNVNTSGLPTTSNNITLAGQGFPVIQGITSQKAETTSADANVLTVTPASVAGSYRLCTVISVSAATSGVIGWTATWTDSNGTAQSPVELELFQNATAAPALTFTTSAAGNYHSCAEIDVNSAGTNIVIKWIGGGTTTAKMTAWVERIV